MYLVPPKHRITQSHMDTHTHAQTQQLGSGDWVCGGINALYLNNVQTVDKLQQTPAASENEQTVMCGKIRFFWGGVWNDCLCCFFVLSLKGVKCITHYPAVRKSYFSICFIFRLCLPHVSIIKDVCKMSTFILTEKYYQCRM